MLYFKSYQSPLSFYDLELIYELVEKQKTTDKDKPGFYEVSLESGTKLEYRIEKDYTITLTDWT